MSLMSVISPRLVSPLQPASLPAARDRVVSQHTSQLQHGMRRR